MIYALNILGCPMRQALRLARLSGVLLTLGAGAALAGEPVDSVETADGIRGLVVNQTFTPNGYAFYQMFSELWREKPDGENYMLSIVERPSKRHGNQIQVLYGQRRLFAGFVPNRYDRIRPACEKAVEEVNSNLILINLENSDATDPDVARKDEF